MGYKAVLMAGGCGTRGKPYTEFIPKASIPIHGRPTIAHIARYIAGYSEIKEIIILADYTGLGSQIQNYFGDSKVCGKRIRFIQDSQSGTGGDLLCLKPHIDEKFILWFADNICAANVSNLMHTLDKTDTLACVAVRSTRREQTGFADVQANIVKKFVEKPTITLAMKECIGIYALSAKVLKFIQKVKMKKPSINLSYDILEPMAAIGHVSAYDIGNIPWIDVQSPMVLERYADDVNKALGQMLKVHQR